MTCNRFHWTRVNLCCCYILFFFEKKQRSTKSCSWLLAYANSIIKCFPFIISQTYSLAITLHSIFWIYKSVCWMLNSIHSTVPYRLTGSQRNPTCKTIEYEKALLLLFMHLVFQHSLPFKLNWMFANSIRPKR